MRTAGKWSGSIVEFLDQGRFQAGLVVRDQDRHLAILDAAGQERLVSRDLIMQHHPERRPGREEAGAAISALQAERATLAGELDLNLLWEVAQEQGRSFSAGELAELFFGRRSPTGTSVMLEALINDRLFFVRRHLELLPRPADQVERLRVQQDRIRGRSESARRMQSMIRDILSGAAPAPSEETAALSEEVAKYLRNPFTRSRELTQVLAAAAPDVDPAEASFEILERLDARPDAPRFACIAGLHPRFSEAAENEAASTCVA